MHRDEPEIVRDLLIAVKDYSPYCNKQLIHFYARMERCQVAKYIEQVIGTGLIVRYNHEPQSEPYYRITDRGIRYLELIELMTDDLLPVA